MKPWTPNPPTNERGSENFSERKQFSEPSVPTLNRIDLVPKIVS